jgi:transcription-repair coupling factor (superfamily II helicase)
VAEARGEARPTPPSVVIDVPGDAHLPKDYVTAEDSRLEAYRRLASVTTDADADDIGKEWADRYGPLPPPAVGLLALARLRTAALARDITEITMSSVRPSSGQRPTVKILPVRLPASAEVRLRRLFPGATYREELQQLLVPIPAKVLAADALRELLEDLLPLDTGA